MGSSQVGTLTRGAQQSSLPVDDDEGTDVTAPQQTVETGRADAKPLADRAVDAGLGAAGFALGLLPWQVHGARLPISSAWPAHEVEATPWVALPFGEHRAGTLLAVSVVAGSLAVLLPHLVRYVLARTRSRSPRRPALVPVVVGALLIHGATLLQTLLAVGPGLSGRREAGLLVAALTTIAVVGGLAGLGLGLLACRGRPVAGALAASASVWMLPSWLTLLLVPDPIATSPLQSSLSTLVPWLPAVLHGVALARLGLASPARMAAWPVTLGLAVLAQAVTTGLFYAGSMAHAGSASPEGRAELVDASTDVVLASLGWHLAHPWPLLLAVAIGVAGDAVLRATGRR